MVRRDELVERAVVLTPTHRTIVMSASPSFNRSVRQFAPAAILALLLTTCGPGIDSADGRIVVHNTDEPLWAPGEEWQVVEELRIGSAMSEGPDLFGAVYSFDVDAWGRIFVLDDHAQEVRVFDPAGAFVRTVGKKGEGPGEFTSAVSVDLSRNGEIWVMDMGEGRVSIFDTIGAYLRQERTSTGGWTVRPLPRRVRPDGPLQRPDPDGGNPADGPLRPVLQPGRHDPHTREPVKREFFETPG